MRRRTWLPTRGAKSKLWQFPLVKYYNIPTHDRWQLDDCHVRWCSSKRSSRCCNVHSSLCRRKHHHAELVLSHSSRELRSLTRFLEEEELNDVFRWVQELWIWSLYNDGYDSRWILKPYQGKGTLMAKESYLEWKRKSFRISQRLTRIWSLGKSGLYQSLILGSWIMLSR